MDTKYKIIKEAFEREGLDRSRAEFSITQYSLNTSLSFKFENYNDLLLFLNIDKENENDAERVKKIKTMVVDAGLDPESFFFVNFYKPKVAEL